MKSSVLMEKEYRSIAVYNLPKDIQEYKVRERFSHYGAITGVFFSDCAILIEYEKVESAIQAILDEDGQSFQGHDMAVQIMKGADDADPVEKKQTFIDPLKHEHNLRIEDLEDAVNTWPSGCKPGISPLDEKEDREEYRGRRSSGIGRIESPTRASPRERNAVVPINGGNDVEILVMDIREREYAELIEDKLKMRRLQVDLLFPNQNASIPVILRNIAARGTLFALQVDATNARYQTVTFYKLQDTLRKYEDLSPSQAVEIIVTDINSAASKFYSPKQKVFHPKDISSLLHLLIENRPLTANGYAILINYLNEQRLKISPRGKEVALLDRRSEHNLSLEEQEEKVLGIVNNMRETEAQHTKPSVIETLHKAVL